MNSPTLNMILIKKNDGLRFCNRCKSQLPPYNQWASALCKKCLAAYELKKEKEMKEFQRQYENERIEKEMRLAPERWRNICPPLYLETTENELPQALLQKVMSWEYGRMGLMLHGETGTCKTRCMYLLVKKMILEKLKKVRVFMPGEFESECISNFNDGGDGPEWTNRIKYADIVFFDDFLKSKVTPRVRTELFQTVDYRHAYQLPILVTTNLAPDQMARQYGGDEPEAFVRRLLEMVEVVSVPLAADGKHDLHISRNGRNPTRLT